MKMMKEKMTSIIGLRRFIVKLRKCMLFLQKQPVRPMILAADEGPDEFDVGLGTPRSDGVRRPTRGHFAVSAVNGEEEKRYMVNIRQLNNPAFLKLLDQSKDEFGESFRHEGALAVPCNPDELEKILEEDFLEGL